MSVPTDATPAVPVRRSGLHELEALLDDRLQELKQARIVPLSQTDVDARHAALGIDLTLSPREQVDQMIATTAGEFNRLYKCLEWAQFSHDMYNQHHFIHRKELNDKEGLAVDNGGPEWRAYHQEGAELQRYDISPE
jgi:hypothetical protein